MITFSKAQTTSLSIRFHSSFRKEKAGKMIPFRNRRDGGKKLAQKLLHYANHPDVIVLALPRGGVPVAYEVALALNVPMDVFIVRKLGLPGHEELAIGAIASGGIRVLNDYVVRAYGISRAQVEAVTAA